MANDRIMLGQQATDFLLVRVKTLQAWRVRGGGPKFLKLGRSIRYRQSDLEAFLAEHTFLNTSSIASQNAPKRKISGREESIDA
jgi:Helix-turn-helix domain